jgi:CRISPR-associated protein Csm3
MNIKMVAVEEFVGLLEVLGSGLRIGGPKEGVGIGETDNPIIRNPITQRPYVPGSSIKGKVRCLLEQKYSNDSQVTGKPCKCGVCAICELFGCGDTKTLKSPTRLVFRDCQPTKETDELWTRAGTDSEIKTEVLINRQKGNASHGGLRTTERIPAGSKFDFSMSIRLFEGDNHKEFYSKLAEGFDLMEKTYLGGSGSRGYGKVTIKTLDGKSFVDMFREKSQEDK